MSREEIIHAAWLFASGAIIALLRSIVDGTRRSVARLLVGCAFGGIGAYMAGFAFKDAWFAPFAIGAAAVMTEHLALGLYRLGVAFSEKPLVVMDRLKGITDALGTAMSPMPKGDDEKKDE